MPRVSWVIIAAPFVLGVAALSRATEASSVQVWVTPSVIAPTPHAYVTVHVRGLRPNIMATVAINPPPPAMYTITSRQVQASVQGSIDQALTFRAQEPGAYSAVVSWGNQNTSSQAAQAPIVVRPRLNTNCAGRVPIPHVFSHQPEVLVQGTLARPGTMVWLLGIGYDPCARVTLAIAPPNADYSVVDPGVRTDRFGNFRVPVHIAKGYKQDMLFVYPRVNAVTKPVVAIPVNHYF